MNVVNRGEEWKKGSVMLSPGEAANDITAHLPTLSLHHSPKSERRRGGSLPLQAEKESESEMLWTGEVLTPHLSHLRHLNPGRPHVEDPDGGIESGSERIGGRIEKGLRACARFYGRGLVRDRSHDITRRSSPLPSLPRTMSRRPVSPGSRPFSKGELKRGISLGSVRRSLSLCKRRESQRVRSSCGRARS